MEEKKKGDKKKKKEKKKHNNLIRTFPVGGERARSHGGRATRSKYGSNGDKIPRGNEYARDGHVGSLVCPHPKQG